VARGRRKQSRDCSRATDWTDRRLLPACSTARVLGTERPVGDPSRGLPLATRTASAWRWGRARRLPELPADLPPWTSSGCAFQPAPLYLAPPSPAVPRRLTAVSPPPAAIHHACPTPRAQCTSAPRPIRRHRLRG
jgi:hypothetical protein